MSLNKKLRTCILTFILIVSSFSIFVISPENVKGFDFEELGEEELILLGMHPFVTAGWYVYDGNKTMEFSGDIVFNLYYYNTFASQFGFKDNLKVTLYTLTPLFSLKEVKNGNKTITLEPEKFGDAVQYTEVKLENISLKLDEGDMVIFAVEIIQTDKPIGNIIGKRLGNKLFDKIRDIGEFLNNTNNNDLREIGNITLQMLGLTEEAGITEEEIAGLLNSFSSSKFVYNSEEYPSSVKLHINSTENITLYFHNSMAEGNEGYEGDGFGVVNMFEEAPNGTSFTWPAHVFTLEGEENFDNYMAWLSGWLLYITGGFTPNGTEQNLITFYLNGENKLVTEKPKANSPTRLKLKKDIKYKWSGMTFSRNRIIMNVSAELYMFYSKILLFRKITLNATIYDETEGKAVASVVQQLDRTKILELIFRKPNSPTIFEFNNAEEKELWYNHNYSLILSYTGGPLFTLRTIHLLYNSDDFPSSVTFELEETDNIKITNDVEDIDVIPGGSAEFEFDIESKYSDTLNIEVIPKDPEDLEEWDIQIPDPVSINEDGKETLKVKVTSKNDVNSAYGEDIELTFNIIGNTGFASKKADVDVSEKAANYFFEIEIPKNKEIKHGEKGVYTFRIKNKNTGYMTDSYEIIATSEHDWRVEVDYDDEAVIEVGEELVLKVSVLVPAYTEIESDKLYLLIKSVRSEEYKKLKTVNVDVNTAVILPNILENIFHFFETTSRSLGLDDVIGGYAPGFLIFIIIFITLIFLLVIIYLIRLKYVEIICIDRIKEIRPDEIAEFNLEIRNPFKRKLTYEIFAEVNSDPESWEINLDNNNIILESKDKQAIKLTVEPTDYAKQDEWVEIKITATAVEKKKGSSISTVTSIKDAMPDIRLLNVFHWPKVFNKDQRVVTSFRVENRGKVSTDKISVILYVNSEEKNKVEDIIIPRGGYAEIEMPWIAVKGKNKVDIVVK